MKQSKYKVSDRVEYVIRPTYTIGRSLCKGRNIHRVGYIKKAEHKMLRGWVYYICVAIEKDYRIIDIVPEKEIFGIVKNKEVSNSGK